MLGSDFDGEVLAAARMVEAVRREAGMTWEQVLDLSPPTWRDDLNFVMEQSERLSEWDQDFCRSIATRNWLSPKQREVLSRLVDKCRHEAPSWPRAEA